MYIFNTNILYTYLVENKMLSVPKPIDPNLHYSLRFYTIGVCSLDHQKPFTLPDKILIVVCLSLEFDQTGTVHMSPYYFLHSAQPLSHQTFKT